MPRSTTNRDHLFIVLSAKFTFANEHCVRTVQTVGENEILCISPYVHTHPIATHGVSIDRLLTLKSMMMGTDFGANIIVRTCGGWCAPLQTKFVEAELDPLSVTRCDCARKSGENLYPHQVHALSLMHTAYETREPCWAWIQKDQNIMIVSHKDELCDSSLFTCNILPVLPFRWFILGDDSGLGKTRTVLSFLKPDRANLVITSKVTEKVWSQEAVSMGYPDVLGSTVIISREMWVRRTQKWLGEGTCRVSPKRRYVPSTTYDVLVVDDAAMQMCRRTFTDTLYFFLRQNPTTFVVFLGTGVNVWDVVEVTTSRVGDVGQLMKQQWVKNERELRTIGHSYQSGEQVCLTVIPVKEMQYVEAAVRRCKVRQRWKFALAGVPTTLSNAPFVSSDQCPLCLQEPTDPVILSCGHSLCFECLLQDGANKCCLCESTIEFDKVQRLCARSDHSVCSKGRLEWLRDRLNNDYMTDCMILCDGVHVVEMLKDRCLGDRDVTVLTFTGLLSTVVPSNVKRVLLWAPPINTRLWRRHVRPKLCLSEVTVLVSSNTPEKDEINGLFTEQTSC